jgi:hypothetical protein
MMRNMMSRERWVPTSCCGDMMLRMMESWSPEDAEKGDVSSLSSLGLGARAQRSVVTSGGAMESVRRGETYHIVAIPLAGSLGFSVRRRLTKGCQIHLS